MFGAKSAARGAPRAELLLADEEAALATRLKHLQADLAIEHEKNTADCRVATYLMGGAMLVLTTFLLLAYQSPKYPYQLANPKLNAAGQGKLKAIVPGTAAHLGNETIVELAAQMATPSDQLPSEGQADPRARLAGVVVGYGKKHGITAPGESYPCSVAREAHKCDLDLIMQDVRAELRCTRIKRVCPWLFPDHNGGPQNIEPERYAALRQYIDFGGMHRDPFQPPPPAPPAPASPSPPPYGYDLFGDRHDPNNAKLSGGDRFAQPLGGYAPPSPESGVVPLSEYNDTVQYAMNKGLIPLPEYNMSVFNATTDYIVMSPDTPKAPSAFADVIKSLDERYGAAA